MKPKFAILGTCALVLALVVPYATGQTCTPPPPGLVSWWTADGTTLDFLGNNNGTAVAATGSSFGYAAGEVADAFSFTGTQYVDVPRSASLEPAHVTVDAWVNSPAFPGAFKYVVSKGGVDNTAASYALYTGKGGDPFGLFFYVYDGTGVTGVHYSPGALSANVWNGAWHHVAGSYDGTDVHLFVDGTEVSPPGTATAAAIAYSLTDTNDLFIGNYDPSCGSSEGCVDARFIGEIDEVEVFNNALSAASIAAIHTAGTSGKCLPAKIQVGFTIPDILELFFAGRLTIDIFGTPAFNTGSIVQSSLLLLPADTGRNRNETVKCISKDVKGDTIPGLECRFPVDLFQLLTTPHLTVTVDGLVTVPGGERIFTGSENLAPQGSH